MFLVFAVDVGVFTVPATAGPRCDWTITVRVFFVLRSGQVGHVVAEWSLLLLLLLSLLGHDEVEVFVIELFISCTMQSYNRLNVLNRLTLTTGATCRSVGAVRIPLHHKVFLGQPNWSIVVETYCASSVFVA